MTVTVVDLAEKFARFADPWHPRIVGELNDTYVKVVRLQGEFVWHHHDDEDELFLVVAGTLRMQLRDRGAASSAPVSSSWCRAASSTGRSPTTRSKSS